mmetsp:Transcript_15173/g.30649  ORF Transcript_15173/g.30649 Transcript_15173/m.30649 type:complete len:283 (-) Transcript_15173:199-1047(-)
MALSFPDSSTAGAAAALAVSGATGNDGFPASFVLSDTFWSEESAMPSGSSLDKTPPMSLASSRFSIVLRASFSAFAIASRLRTKASPSITNRLSPTVPGSWCFEEISLSLLATSVFPASCSALAVEMGAAVLSQLSSAASSSRLVSSLTASNSGASTSALSGFLFFAKAAASLFAAATTSAEGPSLPSLPESMNVLILAIALGLTLRPLTSSMSLECSGTVSKDLDLISSIAAAASSTAGVLSLTPMDPSALSRWEGPLFKASLKFSILLRSSVSTPLPSDK